MKRDKKRELEEAPFTVLYNGVKEMFSLFCFHMKFAKKGQTCPVNSKTMKNRTVNCQEFNPFTSCQNSSTHLFSTSISNKLVLF
jgi:hypothetical protein